MKFDEGRIESMGEKEGRERKKREREIWVKMVEKGREPFFIDVQWMPGCYDLATWAPTRLKPFILQRST